MGQKSPSGARVRVFGRPQRSAAVSGAAIRPGLFYVIVAGLLASNALTLVGFLMAPDIAALLRGETDRVIVAYEDRIAQLRVEVDRLHSRQYAQAGDINLQLQELTQQQEILLEQHQYVRQLAAKASELGLETVAAAPEPAPSTARPSGAGAEGEIAAAGDALADMMRDSRQALAAISDAATASTETIVAELRGIGLVPDLPDEAGLAMGGPLLPPVESRDASAIIDDANAVALALARYKAARGFLAVAPIRRPLDGIGRTSSGFGNRKDPFTRGRAFHAGIDFPAPTGTIVLSAGAGKVTFVGRRSGYGNLVEVSHGNGLVTRYAHLSGFIASEGQAVATGTPIARVGSTGRSTGPHLHFEVRRQGEPVDPTRFLAAGKRLARFFGA